MKRLQRTQSSGRTELIRFIETYIGGSVYFWAAYILIIHLNDRIGLLWAYIIGNAVGISINFFLQRFWVFKARKNYNIGGVSMKYIIVTMANLAIGYLILRFLKSNGVDVKFGQFITAGFSTVWNYVWYRYWVFPDAYRTKEKGRI